MLPPSTPQSSTPTRSPPRTHVRHAREVASVHAAAHHAREVAAAHATAAQHAREVGKPVPARMRGPDLRRAGRNPAHGTQLYPVVGAPHRSRPLRLWRTQFRSSDKTPFSSADLGAASRLGRLGCRFVPNTTAIGNKLVLCSFVLALFFSVFL
jgi:hypothetical protein